MISRLLIIITFFYVISCSNDKKKQSSEGNHSEEIIQSSHSYQLNYVDSLEKFIGKWGSNGEVILVIDRKDENLIITPTKKIPWNLKHSQTKYEKERITFNQRYYISNDGKPYLEDTPYMTDIHISPEHPNILEVRMFSVLTMTNTQKLNRLK